MVMETIRSASTRTVSNVYVWLYEFAFFFRIGTCFWARVVVLLLCVSCG